MKFSIIVIMFLATACSKSSNNAQEPDQYGGRDLYNELSDQEKTLLGTWYFAYEIFNLKNGTDSISTETLISYFPFDATDTLHFLSTQFVGHTEYCPLVAPDSIKNKLKVCFFSYTEYLVSCFPDYISGWFIKDNMLANYNGIYGPGLPLVMEYCPIEKLNNDSLVFIYPEHLDIDDSLKTYFNRKPVFYKQ